MFGGDFGPMGFLEDLPVVGSFFGDPAGEKQMKNYKQMMAEYEAQRPINREARMNALRQQLSLFGPMNDLLKQYYGPDAGYDFSQVFKNPYPEQAQQTSTKQLTPEERKNLPESDPDKYGTSSIFGYLHNRLANKAKGE